MESTCADADGPEAKNSKRKTNPEKMRIVKADWVMKRNVNVVHQ